METRSQKREAKKKKKWVYWLVGMAVGLILLVGGYAYYIYDKVGETMSGMHTPLDRDENPERQASLKSIFKETKPVNILLLGVDQRPGDKGRSDTMILMSLNPKINSMAMVSIPRDTYVDIPGHGMDKINHAYAYGDVDLAIKTIEKAFDVPIHFYASVNMEGFEQGVNALGGVTIQNDQVFSQGGNQFKKGNIHLNGQQALEYIRMRKDDPRGDLGRNERQRKVVTAAVDKTSSFSSITKVGSILNILGNNVKTDLNKNNMQTLFSDYRQTRGNIKNIEIKGTGKTIKGVWYYIVPQEEMQRIHTEIINHMEAK